ncbi:MAG: phospholipase D-like domain-containing protein, partial [Chthoniobacteraceae bacterium]|nr:phospholipase D-like domain-containing protein [Chthoniobacteraceae bacterium]
MNSQKQKTDPPVPSTFRWLPTGADGLDAMLAAMGRATRSICFEMYIFTAGALGKRFREALVQARQRGVRVQVLLDAFGSIGLPAHFWDPLIQLGGEFRWFNAFRASERYGRRNHRKLLVVDGAEAIVGGFNVAENYHGDGVAHGWRDLGLHIAGPLAEALEASFGRIFAKAAARPLLRRLRLPRLHKRPETAVEGCPWTLLLSEPGRGHRAFKRALLDDLASARLVQIICAYFVPTWRLRRALMRVARHGGRVQLLLAGRSDIEAARLASHSLYAKLMSAGVEIYEYQPQVLHAKLVVIDGVVYAGSANLDARSLNINHELMIRLDDAATAAEARG